MTKRAYSIRVLVLAGLLLSSLFACGVIMSQIWPKNGCTSLGWPQCESPRYFKADMLLLDASYFRSGAVASPIRSGALRGAEEYVFRSIDLDTYGANQEVWRYSNINGADAKFDDARINKFRADLIQAEYVETPYRSKVADRFYSACAMRSEFQLCAALGRYDEYVVFFETNIAPPFMTYTEFQHVLKAIDERMAYYLGKNQPSPPTP
jgi:hypothetical protein